MPKENRRRFDRTGKPSIFIGFLLLALVKGPCAVGYMLSNFCSVALLHSSQWGPAIGRKSWDLGTEATSRYSEGKGPSAHLLALSAVICPDDPLVLRNVGRCLLWKGQGRAAIEMLKRAEALAPDQVLTGWLLASAFWASDRKGDARSTLEQYSIAEVLVRRFIEPAQEAYNSGDSARSIELTRQALQINPDFAYGYFLIGQNLEAIREFREAISSYEMAGMRARSNEWFKGTSYAYAGMIYERQLGQDAMALEFYQKAVGVNQRDSWTWVKIGFLQLRAGMRGESEAAFRMALPLAPAHYGLALIAKQQGQADISLEQLERSVEADPNMLEYRKALADAYRNQGKQAQAAAQYAKVQEIELARAASN